MIFSLTSCGKHEKSSEASNESHQTAASQSPANNYDINTRFVVQTASINDQKPLSASFTSKDNDTTARARISGTLVRLFVDAGSYVSQGQLIGVVDEATYAAQVAAAEDNANASAAQIASASQGVSAANANINAALAGQAKAQADYNRTKTLYNEGVYAKARLEQMDTALKVATAQVEAAKASSNMAKANVTASKAATSGAVAQIKVAGATRALGKIYAPKSGLITSAPVPQGSVVMPGEVIVTISAGNPILRLFAPQNDAKYLQNGQIISVTDNNGNIIDQAKIVKIYPEIINDQVKIDLAATNNNHFIGEKVNVSIPVGARDAITIPKSYIINRQGTDYVRLLKDNAAIEVPVQIGSSMTISAPGGEPKPVVEVLSGLNVNDVIVAPAGFSKVGRQ